MLGRVWYQTSPLWKPLVYIQHINLSMAIHSPISHLLLASTRFLYRRDRVGQRQLRQERRESKSSLQQWKHVAGVNQPNRRMKATG